VHPEDQYRSQEACETDCRALLYITVVIELRPDLVDPARLDLSSVGYYNALELLESMNTLQN
jgi:hypothetical protein